jgi:hypothetical protein
VTVVQDPALQGMTQLFNVTRVSLPSLPSSRHFRQLRYPVTMVLSQRISKYLSATSRPQSCLITGSSAQSQPSPSASSTPHPPTPKPPPAPAPAPAPSAASPAPANGAPPRSGCARPPETPAQRASTLRWSSASRWRWTCTLTTTMGARGRRGRPLPPCCRRQGLSWRVRATMGIICTCTRLISMSLGVRCVDKLVSSLPCGQPVGFPLNFNSSSPRGVDR